MQRILNSLMKDARLKFNVEDFAGSTELVRYILAVIKDAPATFNWEGCAKDTVQIQKFAVTKVAPTTTCREECA